MTDIIRMKVKGIFVFLPLRATLKQFDLQTAFQTLTAIMLKHSGVVQGEKNGKKKKRNAYTARASPKLFEYNRGIHGN